jgi:hypothetical protein
MLNFHEKMAHDSRDMVIYIDIWRKGSRGLEIFTGAGGSLANNWSTIEPVPNCLKSLWRCLIGSTVKSQVQRPNPSILLHMCQSDQEIPNQSGVADTPVISPKLDASHIRSAATVSSTTVPSIAPPFLCTCSDPRVGDWELKPKGIVLVWDNCWRNLTWWLNIITSINAFQETADFFSIFWIK